MYIIYVVFGSPGDQALYTYTQYDTWAKLGLILTLKGHVVCRQMFLSHNT